MKETYIIAIDRPGMGDIPELCRAQTSEVAAAVVRALLDASDPNICGIIVQISRTATKEIAV